MIDSASIPRLSNLHPFVRQKAEQFLLEAYRNGFFLRVTSGYRSPEEQERLYAQGRSMAGDIVTNARAFESFHNFGLAIDVVEIRGGIPIWENPRWNQIGEIGKQFGFKWGGDWTSFKDRPHFEYTENYTFRDLAPYQGNYKAIPFQGAKNDSFWTNIAIGLGALSVTSGLAYIIFK